LKGRDYLKNNKIAPHEAFELHELLTLKNISATKSAVMGGLVQDPALKEILKQDFNTCQVHLKELKNLLLQSEFTDIKTHDDTQDMGGTIRH